MLLDSCVPGELNNARPRSTPPPQATGAPRTTHPGAPQRALRGPAASSPGQSRAPPLGARAGRDASAVRSEAKRSSPGKRAGRGPLLHLRDSPAAPPPPGTHTRKRRSAGSGYKAGRDPARKLQLNAPAHRAWGLPPPDNSEDFQQEEIHVRNKMSHAERPHRDKQHQYYESHGSDRHHEKRRATKPYPSNGRSTQGTPGNQHSRTSIANSDLYPKNPLSTHGYVNSPPNYGPEKESFSKKCNDLCSKRGILKFVEITVNILVLICIGASHAAVSGFSSMGGLGTGSFNIGSFYSPFEGTEFQEVRDLDMQYSQMRAPCVYGGVAFSLTLAALTLLFLVVGAKPIDRLSVKLLMAECAFDALACIVYIAAVGLYLHFIIQVNATDTCKKRERLYARRGYTWMNCEVQGGDAAVSLFGIVAACLYFSSSVICALKVRNVRAFRGQRTRTQYSLENSYRERENQKDYRSPQSTHNAQTLATLV